MAATRLPWSNRMERRHWRLALRASVARLRRARISSSIHSAKMQKAPDGAFLFLAERVGFEPTVRENRTPDFETGPFDHSGTSPVGAVILVSILAIVKCAF